MSEDEALDPVGLTEVPPEQLALHQVGVYRIEPTGEEERMQMYGAAPMAYYVRYLRVPGGYVVELQFPESKHRRAGLRPTFVPLDGARCHEGHATQSARLLNVKEAAVLTRLRISTIYTYAERKRIPHIKMGSRLLFNEEQLVQWVDSHAVPTETQC